MRHHSYGLFIQIYLDWEGEQLESLKKIDSIAATLPRPCMRLIDEASLACRLMSRDWDGAIMGLAHALNAIYVKKVMGQVDAHLSAPTTLAMCDLVMTMMQSESYRRWLLEVVPDVMSQLEAQSLELLGIELQHSPALWFEFFPGRQLGL